MKVYYGCHESGEWCLENKDPQGNLDPKTEHKDLQNSISGILDITLVYDQCFKWKISSFKAGYFHVSKDNNIRTL